MSEQSTRSFGLIEVLVVIGVLLMAAFVLLPSINGPRGLGGRRTNCMNNIRHLTLAVLQYEQFHGAYPGYDNLQAFDEEGAPRRTGWIFPLLPGLENQSLFDSFREGGELAGESVNVYLNAVVCPSDALIDRNSGVPRSSYVANTGLRDAIATADTPADWPANGVFHSAFPFLLDGKGIPRVDENGEFLRPKLSSNSSATIVDGLGQTFLLSENVDAGRWTDGEEHLVGFIWQASVDQDGIARPAAAATANVPDESMAQRLFLINEELGVDPAQLGYATARPSSFHPGGVVVTFCDGRTQFIDEQIDYVVYCQLMTPHGARSGPPGSLGLRAAGERQLFVEEDDRATSGIFESRAIYALTPIDEIPGG